LNSDQEFFERRIVTGMIVSKDYLDRIHKFWDSTLLESPELKMIADWCMDYYEKYNRAPDSNIESIYMASLKGNFLSKAEAQYIEELLSDLSDEFGRDSQFNSAYLFDQTVKYLKARELERHSEEIQGLIEMGKEEEAEKLAQTYTPKIAVEVELGLDLSSKEALKRVERAFTETGQRVLSYPGALGNMWNEHLIRGGFFTFLGPEKRGKTFLLLELSLRAIRQKANVAFFAAGDMTEAQMLRRICVYITKRSDREKYCQERFIPVGDCILNQLNLCGRVDRNCDHGISDIDLKTFYQDPTRLMNIETLREKFEDFPDYEPCDSHSCDQRRGSVWLKKVPATRPLTANQAKKAMRRFFHKYRRRFKLATYPAGILTVSEIRRILNDWEKYDGFVPDLIAIDYADLLSADDGKVNEFRHRQDHIWKSLRALSQERHVLLVTATQADADSYKKEKLSLSNFSEDKRKLAHVTAQYGLNQDPQGREKKLGIMRINEIVVREGDFSTDNEVFILQDLAAGRPFLESFILQSKGGNESERYNRIKE
jgi:hypothetical protein